MKSGRMGFAGVLLFVSMAASAGQVTGPQATRFEATLQAIAIASNANMGDCSSGKCSISALNLMCIGKSNGHDRVTSCTLFGISPENQYMAVSVNDNKLASALADEMIAASGAGDAGLGSISVEMMSVSCASDRSAGTASCSVVE